MTAENSVGEAAGAGLAFVCRFVCAIGGADRKVCGVAAETRFNMVRKYVCGGQGGEGVAEYIFIRLDRALRMRGQGDGGIRAGGFELVGKEAGTERYKPSVERAILPHMTAVTCAAP